MSSDDKSVIKQTGIVGSVQVIRLFIGLIRNKLLALFFGTQGVGIWAICLAFTEMMQQASFLGMDKAGVKKIAENTGDEKEKVIALRVIRFSFFINSLVIFFSIVVLSEYLDATVFKQIGAGASVLIALYLLFNCNSLCFNSLLNGLREIKKYALSQFFGVVVGNLIIFSVLPFVSIDYLPYCFVVIGVSNLIFSAYFYRKLNFNQYTFPLSIYFSCYRSILKVGIGFWFPALYLALCEYLIRQYLMSALSIDMLGVYQACWTISNMYIGIILSSMGVALFPKLCEIVNDKRETINVLNTQIEFGILISIPFLVVIIFFAPEILSVLYSNDFSAGADIILWQIAGVLMRLLGFPFGYALMARGNVYQYVFSQIIFSTFNVVIMVLCVESFGVSGVGVNYLGSYTIYLIVIFLFCKFLIGFEFSSSLNKSLLYVIAIIALSYGFNLLFDGVALYIGGVVVSICTTTFSVYMLKKEYNLDVIGKINNKLRGQVGGS